MAVFGLLLMAVGVMGLLRFGIPLAISAIGEFSFLFIKKTDTSKTHRANNRVFLKDMALKVIIAVVALLIGWFLLQLGS